MDMKGLMQGANSFPQQIKKNPICERKQKIRPTGEKNNRTSKHLEN